MAKPSFTPRQLEELGKKVEDAVVRHVALDSKQSEQFVREHMGHSLLGRIYNMDSRVATIAGIATDLGITLDCEQL